MNLNLISFFRSVLFLLFGGIILAGCTSIASLPTLPSSTPVSTSTYPETATPQLFPEQKTAAIPTATLAPTPFRFSPEPSPSFTPTPTVSWNADDIEANWSIYTTAPQPEWLSNTFANLAVSHTDSSDEYIGINIATGKETKTVIGRDDTYTLYTKIYSPDHAFVVECDEGGRMVRVKDQSPISSTPLLQADNARYFCSTTIHWADDSSAVAFAGPDQCLYIWRNDGSDPRKIFIGLVQNTDITWSPDSRELAYLIHTSSSQIDTAEIMDLEGRILHEFPVLSGEPYVLRWKTQDVLASVSKYETWFYETQSGSYLFNWEDHPTGGGIRHQSVQFSPDSQWAFIDQGERMHESINIPKRMILDKTYSLFDIKAKISHTLSDRSGNYLVFAGWSADSSKMYLVHLPGELFSTADAAMPFGLDAYDLHTRKVELLLENAIQVKWNAEKSMALVTFATTDQQGNITLAGGLWNPRSKTVVGQWTVANQIIYQDSSSPLYNQVSVAWTKDGQSVAVCDKSGLVKIINAQGQEKVLTTELGQNNGLVTLLWSPDEHHLIVIYAGRAWVVNVLQ